VSTRRTAVLLASAVLFAAAPLPAQAPASDTVARPAPYPVSLPVNFQRAIARGTRAPDGRPGPRYWQQWADYRIQAELDPATHRLTGTETIRYQNRSPDTLRLLILHLRANLFAPDAQRNRTVPVTEPVTLTRVAVNGEELRGPGAAGGGTPMYNTNGTLLGIRMRQPLLPGATAELALAWNYPVPPNGAPRGGWQDSVHYVSYWYPQMAVYDDVNGWVAEQYMSNAEFYMGYGSYDVSLTVPAGYLVTATGRLANADSVLSKQTRDRLRQARRTRDIVHVVTEQDRGAGKATAAGTGGKLTWRFVADSVRDFAWGTAPDYLWDATHAVVGDATGDGKPDTTNINAFWRPQGRPAFWQENARYGRHSVEFLSNYLWPYPWPHMTAVDGPQSCGGMEYPMMTCIGGARDSTAMYGVTLHEIAHMWFPMQVGSNEKRHSWMDEGLTQFNESQGSIDFFGGTSFVNDVAGNRDSYLALARSGNEVDMMRHGDLYGDRAAFGIASYFKPATLMVALRGILGEETFNRAYREYGARWRFRHPSPYDFFNTFESVAGRDLDWFWRPWFFETWTMDQAIAGVEVQGDSVAITVEDRGLAPMPVRLSITRQGAAADTLTVPADVWLDGARRHTVKVPARGGVTRVVIDAEEFFPDLDRTNQTWSAGTP
jgi:hypothetical protein